MGVERSDGGRAAAAAAEAARRAAEEAARRAREEAARKAREAAAKRAQEAARLAAQLRSAFDPAKAARGPKLDATRATSLLTENARDGRVNCLDLAADWAKKATPELRGRSELVFLADSRGGAEGNAGHVVVRQGNRVFDPGSGQSYEDLKAFRAEQPHYQEVGTLSATSAAKVFDTEPGSPERAKALSEAKVPPRLQKMMVADLAPVDGGSVPAGLPKDVPHPVDTEASELKLPPLQAGPIEVEITDEVEKVVEKKDGYVTVKIDAETSAAAKGTLELKRVSIGGGMSAGKNLSYEVRMKEEDFERLKRGELPPPHPLDPSTLPDGASIRLEQTQFKGTSMEAAFSYHLLELGTESDIKEGKGLSMEISRNGDKVQVTAGPTEFIENDGSVSLGVGPVSVSMGNTTKLQEYKLRTAEFDLSTEGGAKAFQDFRNGGRLPEKDGAGVSNALRLDKVAFESEGKVGLSLGPIDLEGSLGKNTGDLLVTHHPDGTRSVTMEAVYGGDHPNLTAEARYGKDGKLIPGSEKFALTFDNKDDQYREMMVYAFTGDAEQAKQARGHDKPITLNLTAAQMKELQRRAKEPEMSHMGLGGLLSDYDGNPAEPLAAARAMACSPAFNEYRLQQSFWGLYLDSGRTRPLPGELTFG